MTYKEYVRKKFFDMAKANPDKVPVLKELRQRFALDIDDEETNKQYKNEQKKAETNQRIGQGIS